MADVPWTDLVDPSREEIARHAPRDLHERAAERLAARATDDATRPSIEGHGDYVFGVLLAAVAVPEEDRVYYQEIDFVLTQRELLTVRKTPPDGEPYDIATVQAICAVRENVTPGIAAYHVVDDIAERYLALLDAVEDEIDEAERGVTTWSPLRVHQRLSDLRRDLLRIRRTLTPTRDAVRGIVDGRVDLEGRPLFRREVFPRDVEIQFGEVYDKLLRASESLDYARDLVGSVRDYHQTRIATDQNEVVKKLAVIASLILIPTFIVGVYGQNFEHMPELRWQLGYAFSWAVIIVSTLAQLAFFRWKRWI